MVKYKIIYDKETCIGCGNCVSVCPSNWEEDGDKVKPKKTKIKEVDCNQKAADACPVGAIKIEKIKD